MNSDKINIADLQQLNVSTLTTIRDAFNSAESLDMAEFVEVLKLAHEKEFQKLIKIFYNFLSHFFSIREKH